MIRTVLLSGPSTRSSSAVNVTVPVPLVWFAGIVSVPPLTATPAAAVTVTVVSMVGAGSAVAVTVTALDAPSSIDAGLSASVSSACSSSRFVPGTV